MEKILFVDDGLSSKDRTGRSLKPKHKKGSRSEVSHEHAIETPMHSKKPRGNKSNHDLSVCLCNPCKDKGIRHLLRDRPDVRKTGLEQILRHFPDARAKDGPSHSTR